MSGSTRSNTQRDPAETYPRPAGGDDAAQAEHEQTCHERTCYAMTTAAGSDRPDFGTLELLRLIVHEVPRAYRGDDGAPLGLSDGVSNLDDTVAADLQARLRELLARTSRPVVEDAAAAHPCPSSLTLT